MSKFALPALCCLLLAACGGDDESGKASGTDGGGSSSSGGSGNTGNGGASGGSGGSGNGTSSGGSAGSGGSGTGGSGGSGNSGAYGGFGGSGATPSTCVGASAPDWFVNQADGTWTTVAGGSGETIADHLPNPVPHANGAGDSPNSITAAWTGGAVDQARGEYILAANGGHADYPGNEAYALSLREAAPSWRRMTDPTPNDQLGNVTNEGNGLYADGRPRAMHTTFECFGDGRVWFPLQNSVTSGGGGTVNGIVALNRNFLGEATSPLPWTSSDLGAWELFGTPFPPGTDLTSMNFGVCAFDPIGHKIWALGGNSANYTIYWSVDTDGSSLGTVHDYALGKYFGHWGTWVIVAPELRILVAGDHLREEITVLNLDSAGQAGDWQEIDTWSGPGFFEIGAGGAYIAQNHSIAIGNPKTTGKAIRKLQIPTKTVNGNVVYDAAGQWVWTTMNPPGPTPSVPAGNSSAYTKWNIVEDMCNGQSAVVSLSDVHGPVYVYKVPAAGL